MGSHCSSCSWKNFGSLLIATMLTRSWHLITCRGCSSKCGGNEQRRRYSRGQQAARSGVRIQIGAHARAAAGSGGGGGITDLLLITEDAIEVSILLVISVQHRVALNDALLDVARHAALGQRRARHALARRKPGRAAKRQRQRRQWEGRRGSARCAAKCTAQCDATGIATLNASITVVIASPRFRAAREVQRRERRPACLLAAVAAEQCQCAALYMMLLYRSISLTF